MEDNYEKIEDTIKELDTDVQNVSLVVSGKSRVAIEDAFVLVSKGNLVERIQKQDELLAEIKQENLQFREAWQRNWALGRTAFFSVITTCIILISLAAYAVRTYGGENAGKIITEMDNVIEEVAP